MNSPDPSGGPRSEEEQQKAFFKAADEQLREGKYLHSELIAARADGDLAGADLLKLMTGWAKSRDYPLQKLGWSQAGGALMFIIGAFTGFAAVGFFSMIVQGRRNPGEELAAFLAIVAIAMLSGGYMLFSRARAERKLLIKQANLVCPECKEPVNPSTKVCPCGYLNTEPQEEVADKLQTPWQVQTSSGPANLDTLSDVKEAILAGRIAKDTRVKPPSDAAPASDSAEEEQETVSVGEVAQTSFELQVLYQPVWAHTLRGLRIGIVAGVSFWLLQLAYSMFFIVDNPIIGGVLVVILLLIAQAFLPVMQNWVLSRLMWAAIPGIIVLLSVNYGIGAVFQNIGRGLMMQLGAIFAGALFGSLLGMIIGTIVGIIRKDKIPRAPDAVDEGTEPVKNGFVIPGIALVVLITLYVTVYMPWLRSALDNLQ